MTGLSATLTFGGPFLFVAALLLATKLTGNRRAIKRPSLAVSRRGVGSVGVSPTRGSASSVGDDTTSGAA